MGADQQPEIRLAVSAPLTGIGLGGPPDGGFIPGLIEVVTEAVHQPETWSGRFRNTALVTGNGDPVQPRATHRCSVRPSP